MAWNIPKELMRNNPLSEEEVRKRFEERGYQIIDYIYKNNNTRIPCYDADGYIVMVSLSSLSKNIKTYSRFSPSCNEKYFMYNINHYRLLHPEVCVVIDWEYRLIGKSQKRQVFLKCICKNCGNIFYMTLLQWRENRNRCVKCVSKKSNIENIVQEWLDENKIDYIPQYRYKDCRDKKPLPFDFYIPSHNLCIEVNGEQHYRKESMGYFVKHKFNEEDIKIIEKHDNIKKNYCKNHGIKLLIIPYLAFHENNYIAMLQNALINNKE